MVELIMRKIHIGLPPPNANVNLVDCRGRKARFNADTSVPKRCNVWDFQKFRSPNVINK